MGRVYSLTPKGRRTLRDWLAQEPVVNDERFDPTEAKQLETMVVHELTHFPQAMPAGPQEYLALYGSKKSLVGLTIREGSAEFIAELVTGAITQRKARAYVMEREKELWKRFEKEMNSAETGEWMAVTPSDPDQPPLMAYMIGVVWVVLRRARRIAGAIDCPRSLLPHGEPVHKRHRVHRDHDWPCGDGGRAFGLSAPKSDERSAA